MLRAIAVRGYLVKDCKMNFAAIPMDENELSKTLAQCKGGQEVQAVCTSFLRGQQERMDERIRTFIQQQQDQFESIRLRTKTERDRILRCACPSFPWLLRPALRSTSCFIPRRRRSSSLYRSRRSVVSFSPRSRLSSLVAALVSVSLARSLVLYPLRAVYPVPCQLQSPLLPLLPPQ